jgi:hypothetical protein
VRSPAEQHVLAVGADRRVLEQVEAEVLGALQAVGAVAAGRRRRGNDAIARPETADAFAHRFHSARPLVAEPAGDLEAHVTALERLEVGPAGERHSHPGHQLAVAGLGYPGRLKPQFAGLHQVPDAHRS